MGDIHVALAYVDNFETTGATNVAWKLDRYWTLQRIRALIRQPHLIHQRYLNACAPAVFFRIWFARDPPGAATFACKMLRDGSAPIGSLAVAAGWRLRDQDYAQLKSVTDSAHPGATPENADWMLLSSLRDSENIFFDYVGEPYTTGDAAAGITLPSTLSSWLNADRPLFRRLQRDQSGVPARRTAAPRSDSDLQRRHRSARQQLVQRGRLSFDPARRRPGSGRWLPHPRSHYVLVTSPFAKSNDSVWLQMETWSWARTVGGWADYAQFFTKYFGPIVATAH